MLTKTQMLALMQLPQMGRKSVIALADYAKQTKTRISGTTELADFLEECAKKKAVRGLKSYLETEINSAFAFANKIEEEAAINGIKITSYNDKDFPKSLLFLKKDGKNDSPAIIFSKGDFSILNNTPSVAIIGTRNPSIAGIITSTLFAEEFAKEGFNIVSGLALGCDTAAHRGALNAGGKTTAILAHGLDMVYPPENKQLLQEIINNGGLAVSEYPTNVRPQQIYFVERDRLQAGLANATIVVEANATSGARHAIKTAINNQKNTYCTELSKDIAPAEDGCLFYEGPALLNEKNLKETIISLKSSY